MQIQCQSCNSLFTLPQAYDASFNGPCRCPGCGATHRLSTSMSYVTALELVDRFPRRTWASPPHVARRLDDVVKCLNARAWVPAAITTRRVLEDACKDLGADGGTLYAMIRNLHEEKGIFDDTTVNFATGLRLFGNAGAHGDGIDGDVTEKDAARAFEIAVELIEAVYMQVTASRAVTPSPGKLLTAGVTPQLAKPAQRTRS